jgi:hypothetical protein
MLERFDCVPLFFAPFVSSVMRIEPHWIDYNGHLNMAYHNVLFDRAVDETYELIGVGADYVANRAHSVYMPRSMRYLRSCMPATLSGSPSSCSTTTPSACIISRAIVPRRGGLGVRHLENLSMWT